MIKNVIKTCCCFVDKAVWFVNQPQSFPLWHFDHVKRQTRIEDTIEKKFIKEIRTVKTYIDGKILVKNTIIVSCVKCYEFQLFHLSSQVNSIFDTINCRFVTTDRFSYSDDFTNDIFTGNSQFVVENYFLPRELREQLFLNDVAKPRILVDSHCINHVLHLFKGVIIDFFVVPVKKSIMNFLKEDYMFSLPHVRTR